MLSLKNNKNNFFRRTNRRTFNMSIFNWKYFSFVNTDWTWAQRELIAIPILVLVLWFGWMKMVRSALVDEQQVILENAKPFSDDEGAQSSQVKPGSSLL